MQSSCNLTPRGRQQTDQRRGRCLEDDSEVLWTAALRRSERSNAPRRSDLIAAHTVQKPHLQRAGGKAYVACSRAVRLPCLSVELAEAAHQTNARSQQVAVATCGDRGVGLAFGSSRARAVKRIGREHGVEATKAPPFGGMRRAQRFLFVAQQRIDRTDAGTPRTISDGGQGARGGVARRRPRPGELGLHQRRGLADRASFAGGRQRGQRHDRDL